MEDTLVAELECPVCRDPVDRPWYLQNKYRCCSIRYCASCEARLTSCPQCRHGAAEPISVFSVIMDTDYMYVQGVPCIPITDIQVRNGQFLAFSEYCSKIFARREVNAAEPQDVQLAMKCVNEQWNKLQPEHRGVLRGICYVSRAAVDAA